MNAMGTIGILSAIIYGLLVDGTYFKIYFILLLGYYVFTQIGKMNKYNTKRVKINIATWNPPSEPLVYFNFDWDFEKAKLYIENLRF